MKQFNSAAIHSSFQFRAPSDLVQLCFHIGIQYNLPSSGINNVGGQLSQTHPYSIVCLCAGSRYLANETNLAGRCPGRRPRFQCNTT